MRTLKLYTILVLAAAVCAAVVALPRRTAFECGQGYTFYTGSASSSCKIVQVEHNPSIMLVALRDVRGEATFFAELDVQEFLNSVGGEVVFCEQLTDCTNYYCTANLPYSVELYGQNINLHICVREDGVAVGTPIIFGGY